MRITGLVVDNVLSFRHEEVTLDTGITTIVGPNGSGKSNLVRLLTLPGAALEWIDQGTPASGDAWDMLMAFAVGRHRLAHDGDLLRLQLDLMLTSADEKQLLTTFIRAAVLSYLMNERDQQKFNGGNDVLDQWVMETITPEVIAPLGTGSLILEHSGSRSDTWQVRFEFGYEGATYVWWLRPGAGRGGLVSSGTELDWSKAQPQPAVLSRGLLGLDVIAPVPPLPGTPVPSLPSPMPRFRLSALMPGHGEIVDLSVSVPNGPFNFDCRAHRLFAETMGISRWRMASQQRYSFAVLLGRILGHGMAFVAEQLRGVATGAQPPRVVGRYAMEEMVSPPRLWEPHALPLRLFRLKNGTLAERERFTRIQALFHELAAGLDVDLSVQFAPLTASAPPSGQATPAQPAPTPTGPEVAVTVVVRGSTDTDGSADVWEMPIVQAGAGVWEALVLAEAIVGTDDKVLILDEPALNLHPGWQRLVLDTLKRRSDEQQVLLITHSPYLVPLSAPVDLSRLLRTGTVDGGTKVHRLVRRSGGTADGDDSEEVERIIREYALSADARALLFARGAVLVEGETELGALPIWLAKSPCAQSLGSPEERQIAFHSVGSDTNFRGVLPLLVSLRIPWVIVCDGGPFAPIAGRNHIFRQVLGAGADLPVLTTFVAERLGASPRVGFDVIKSVAAQHGIFTLAPGWTRARRRHPSTCESTAGAMTAGDESFEAFVESVYPGKLQESHDVVGGSKVRRGRWVAENTDCPAAVEELYHQIVDVLEQRGMPRRR